MSNAFLDAMRDLNDPEILRHELDERDKEIEHLKRALQIASRWGIRSDGYSAQVSCRLREWVDGGMKGEPPEPPEYYPA